jgi:hypothetical protein
MSVTTATVPLLIFEAAGCLMALPASEVAHLERVTGSCMQTKGSEPSFDLGDYFGARATEGPWLRWSRATQSAWLRVHHVVDVVPVALTSLTAMPTLLRRHRRTRAFLAAGVRNSDVFLLLDPARLRDSSGLGDSSGLPDSLRLADSSGLPDSSRVPDLSRLPDF